MKINLEELNKRVEQKLITKQKHPEFPIWIYNYSQSCQFSKAWDEYTMMCRGLILDEAGNVISRPFRKFFNLDELESVGLKLPNEPFEVREKYDGSLGISYWWNGEIYLATRGSFISEQAIMGTKLLNQRDKMKYPLSSRWTYLFEIIYPENRIVVDYKGESKLVLLAIRTVDDGNMSAEVALENIAEFCGFEVAKKIDADDFTKLKELAKPNSEGFVIKFESGFRVKVKFDEYVRLHRIMTGVNARRVWEVLRAGDNLNEFLQGVPEEFEKWITDQKNLLMGQYKEVENKALDIFDNLRAIEPRKNYALAVMETNKELSSILFKMKDEQNYAELIWKMIKPESTAPFKVEI